MTRQPNKPHRVGYEDEENCEGHYDPDEADRRNCHPSSLRGMRSPDDPCGVCFQKWRAVEEAKRKAAWDAKTPDEKTQFEALLKGLRELY